MSSMDENITALRAEVARLKGPARIGPLARLGQALTQRFTRHMTTAPSALSDLNEAVDAYTESYDLMREDDPLRGRLLKSLGFARCVRSTFTNDADDRTASINNLEAALAARQLPAMTTAALRMMLGQQYLARAVAPLAGSINPTALLSGIASPGGVTDLDTAASHFQHVLSGPLVSDDFIEAARAYLEVVAPLRDVLGGSAGGFDLSKLMASAQTLQGLHQRLMNQRPGAGPLGLPSMLSMGEVGSVLDLDPLDYPVAVIRDVDEPVAVVPPGPKPVEPPKPALDDLRESLRERLSLTGSAVPVWEAVAALLSPDATVPTVAVVDDIVALASTVVDHEDDNTDPEDAAVDWFVLAVTLRLRDHIEGAVDQGEGIETLLTAARKAPADHPAAPVILSALGAFLDSDMPLDDPLERFAAGFAGRFDSVLAGESVADPQQRATLDALRCLCRAAFARGELRRTLDKVPPEYPWAKSLRAAVRSMG